jgi:hypothetical protein
VNSQPGGNRPDWLSKHLLPIAGAVVSAILVTALTPLGENLRELLFPTKADVSGSVSIVGADSAGAKLMLDRKPAGTVQDDGTFFIPDVGNGDHTLVIKAVNSKQKTTRFTVERQASEEILGNIPLEPIAALGFDDTQTGFSTWSGTVWIQAEPDVLRRIESVEYTLSAPFSSEPFTVTDRDTGFCRQVPSEDGAQAGGFPSPSAEVKLRRGGTFELRWAFPFGTASCQQSGTPLTDPPSLAPPTHQPPPPPPRPTAGEVPNVIGQQYDNAAGQLQGQGFAVARRDVDSSQPKDTVIDQQPKGGSELARGGTVTLFVSKGPKETTIPDVTSQDEAAATRALEQSGFTVGVVDQDTFDPNQDGIVLSQDPPGGSKAKTGEEVTIVVGRLVEP